MIKIQNIYYMLAYAFQVLNEDRYANIAAEKFDHTGDLLAAILAKGIANQIKRVVVKDYIIRQQSLSSPRGKIDVSTTIKLREPLKKRLVCEFDEFSENAYLNQILKTTSLLLLNSSEVSPEQKKALKRILPYFNAVETLNPRRIAWSSIRYHRNSATYKMLINICFLVLTGLLQTTQTGSIKLATYLDDPLMHRLYEKFVLEYYRKHYPQIKTSPAHIEWNVDNKFTDLLPDMKTDIMLQYKGKILIIDTKYYGHTLQTNPLFNSKTIHSNNLYQIFTYVKNKDVGSTGNVSGVLLYARTDEEIIPNHDYSLGGNKISVKTLDLNTDFTDIAQQLNLLADRLL